MRSFEALKVLRGLLKRRCNPMLDRKRLETLVGQQAPEAYSSLIASLEGIESVAVCKYETPPFLQQRIQVGESEEQIIEMALELRRSTRLPFWEALFSSCLDVGKCTDALLDAALFHNGLGQITELPASDVSPERLRVQSDDGNVGLTSRVKLAGAEVVHFAMMDFHCEVSDGNTEIVAAVCRRLMPGGFLILDSGDSYHACGMTLLKAEERIRFLGKSLFFAPIVDSAYVAHQLIQPMSSIRLSTGGSRTKRPYVVHVGGAA